jgi:transitional endoplasmic reticulum ATPase
MGTTLNSRIYGHAELDGTHRVIIESKRAELIREHGQKSAEPEFVRIGKGDLSCACIVSAVRASTEDVIRIDRFKQLSLKSADGESVSLEFITPVPARHVRLGVRSEFLTRDIARLIGKPVIRSETTAIFALAGEPRLVKILDTQPKGIVLAVPDTEFTTASGMDVGDEFPIAYEDIGGLRREIASIREQIEYPLKFPGIFDRLGIMPPKGVILYGPAGTGKTLIMRALVNEVGAKFYSINGPEVYSMAYGESERRLRHVFEEAARFDSHRRA